MYVHFQLILNLLCSYYRTRLNERHGQCRRPLVTDDINGCVNTTPIAPSLPCWSRMDPLFLTSHLWQGGFAMFYFPPVTGWIQSVFLPVCHRADTMSYFPTVTEWVQSVLLPPVTGWIRNVLLPTCHGVDSQCLTSNLSQGGFTMSFSQTITG